MKLFVWNMLNVPIGFGNNYGDSMICVTANSTQEAIDYIRNELKTSYSENLDWFFKTIQGYYPLMYEKQYCWENPECKWHLHYLEARKECLDNTGRLNHHLWNEYWKSYKQWNDDIWWELSKTPTTHFISPLVYVTPGVVVYSRAYD